MKGLRSSALVFGASGAVLVLEIIAGRIMAPYVGVSLETFTGIIGTCLAGIAAGAAIGGALADRYDPRRLIGPFVVLAGALTWLSLPLVDLMGNELGSGPVSVVLLTTVGFGAPVVLLSAVAPMVAKIRLSTLEETGTIVGTLSAAGTLGALAGTFLTGFVAVSLLPSRPIVAATGAALVLVGLVAWWRLARWRPAGGRVTALALGGIAVAAVAAFAVPRPCEYETAYYCVRIESSPEDPELVSLYLDRLRHAAVDLEDPGVLDIRYVRILADVVETLAPGELDVLHVGGGGFTLPRWIEFARPGSRNHVLEIDGDLVDIAQDRLGLRLDDDLTVDVRDARLSVTELPADRFDLVVGDAFGGESAPWHLTTLEVMRDIERVMTPAAVYAMNVIDGGSSEWARAQIATVAEVFDHVAVVLPPDGVPSTRAVNQVIVASDAPLVEPAIDAGDGEWVSGGELDEYVGDAMVLTDDHAPVDQLVFR
jgi:spermidine synthase/MFS family permease